MSHFTTIQTLFKDKECLIATLKKFFTEVESHQIPQNLIGYQGDVRSETASIIIRRKFVGRASNDIGFQYNPVEKTYQAIISEYDRKHHKYNEHWLNQLKVEYSQQVVEKQAQKIGAKVEKIRMSDGSIQYRIQGKSNRIKNLSQHKELR